jgi:E3 ubiquitin-protein ligase RFWD2
MGSWPPSGDRDNLDAGGADVDKDFLCPICFQAMEDAFLTSCGHSFCYTCITTHLNHKSNCPSCARYLTTEQLIPNFLLTKVSSRFPSNPNVQPKSSMA